MSDIEIPSKHKHGQLRVVERVWVWSAVLDTWMLCDVYAVDKKAGR